MEDLDDAGIGQDRLEPLGRRVAGPDLHHIGAAVAAGHLHDAEPVAMRVEPQRLGIDRDRRARREIGRQVAVVEADPGGGGSHRWFKRFQGVGRPARSTARAVPIAPPIHGQMQVYF
ncbi:hypothetical protein M2437_004274 [Methylorubrum pseudosasae]|nr:hypothetical protein [Methylorubrum pseudosasae]